MRHKNNTTQRNSRKFLKWMAGASLLVILFVCVFSGVLASSFAIQDLVTFASVGNSNGKATNVSSSGTQVVSFSNLSTSDFVCDSNTRRGSKWFTSATVLSDRTFLGIGWRFHNAIGCDQSSSSGEYAAMYLTVPLDEDVKNALKNDIPISATFSCKSATMTYNEWNTVCLHYDTPTNAISNMRYLEVGGFLGMGKSYYGYWNALPNNLIKAYNEGTGKNNSWTHDSGTFSVTGNVPSTATKLVLGFYMCCDGDTTTGFYDIDLTLNYTNTQATFKSEAGGSIDYTQNNGKRTFTSTADPQLVTANPNIGYHFVNWTADKTNISGLTMPNTNASVTFTGGTVKANTTFTANFDINNATIQYHTNGATSGSIANQGITYGTGFTLNSGSTLAKSVGGVSYTMIGWAVYTGDSAPSTWDVQSATYPLEKSGDNIVGKTFADSATQAGGDFNLSLASSHGKTFHLYAVWKASDFGCRGSSTDYTWGTSSNPFLIQTAQHLINLYTIIHTGVSFDSVTGTGLSFLDNAKTNATSTDFSSSRDGNGCFFEVTTNISFTNAQAALFNPIGENATGKKFGATFDGKNYTITVNLANS